MVGNLHRPPSDIADIADTRALTDAHARPPDAGARPHGGGETVAAADDLDCVREDRVARPHKDDARGLNRLTPEPACLRLRQEADGLHVSVRLEIPLTEADIVRICAQLARLEWFDDDISRIHRLFDAAVREQHDLLLEDEEEYD